MAQPYLKRPVGRPLEQSREWCHEFYYKAESWDQHRRIVLVVSERPDDLFLHHFFLVISLDSKDWHGHEVLSLYRRRGKAEGHMGELKDTLNVHLSSWLDETLLHATAKNKLGVALGYLASNWSKLVRYTEAGYLPIDNNAVEGDIRYLAVGRKNWLFSDTPADAHSSAIIYSLMQTAMANGKEPYAWMRFVMEQLPTCQSVQQIEQLLPWNCEPPIYR